MNTHHPSCLKRQFLYQLTKPNPYGTIPRSVRIIVSTEFDASGAVAPPVTTGLDGCGDMAPVLGTSPARTAPESAHARAIAKAKRLIVCFSFEDASPLARKHASVNTYSAIDT